MSYDPFFHFLPQRDVGQDLDWRLQVESRDGACEQALIQSPVQVAVLKAAETANSLTSLMPRCWNCSFKMLKMPLQCTGHRKHCVPPSLNKGQRCEDVQIAQNIRGCRVPLH